jgi:phospholipase/carboxylesterase
LTVTPEEGAPLIFAFHGTGGDENQFFDLAKQLAPGAGIVSPRGNVSEYGAARFFRRTGEGRYDMADLAAQTERMASYVEAWKQKYPTSPIYGFGYSNGANILASVMMVRPDLFDRAGLLHPLIPWAPEPVSGLKNKRVLLTAGRRDPICPWPMTERLVAWLEAQDTNLEAFYHDGGHEMQREELDALIRLMQA